MQYDDGDYEFCSKIMSWLIGALALVFSVYFVIDFISTTDWSLSSVLWSVLYYFMGLVGIGFLGSLILGLVKVNDIFSGFLRKILDKLLP